MRLFAVFFFRLRPPRIAIIIPPGSNIFVFLRYKIHKVIVVVVTNVFFFDYGAKSSLINSLYYLVADYCPHCKKQGLHLMTLCNY